MARIFHRRLLCLASLKPGAWYLSATILTQTGHLCIWFFLIFLHPRHYCLKAFRPRQRLVMVQCMASMISAMQLWRALSAVRHSQILFQKAYALDTTLGLSTGATKTDVINAMAGHILAQDELMGTYGN